MVVEQLLAVPHERTNCIKKKAYRNKSNVLNTIILLSVQRRLFGKIAFFCLIQSEIFDDMNRSCMKSVFC